MGFKIFDSHAKDLYGRGQPQGTLYSSQSTALHVNRMKTLRSFSYANENLQLL